MRSLHIRFRAIDPPSSVRSTQTSSAFVDGFYLPGTSQWLSMNDIERVEVVKGPQSAFFGRATFGGAINFISKVPGNPGKFFPAADAAALTIDAGALEGAADWAERHNSVALLVLHRGVIQLERYWQDIGPRSLFTGRAMTRSILPPLVAIAMQEGAIESLDDPVGRYLPEWRDDVRGRITLRQLLGYFHADWLTSRLPNLVLAGLGN